MNDKDKLANAWPYSAEVIHKINEGMRNHQTSSQARYLASWNRAVQRYNEWVDLNQPILKRTHLAAWNDILQAEGLSQSRELPLPLPSLWRRIFGP